MKTFEIRIPKFLAERVGAHPTVRITKRPQQRISLQGSIRSAERVGPNSTVGKPEQTSIRLAEPVLVLFSIAGFSWTQLLPKASIPCPENGFRSVGDLELGENVQGVVALGLLAQ
jgi:hypothetical protein